MTARYMTPIFLTLLSTSAAAQGTPAKAHICLAPSSVETASGSAATAMSAVRETFTSYLTGPTLEVAPLSSRLESQARQEAKAANCPYLLITTLKQEHKGGGSGLLGRVASGAVQQGVSSADVGSNSAAGRVATRRAGISVDSVFAFDGADVTRRRVLAPSRTQDLAVAGYAERTLRVAYLRAPGLLLSRWEHDACPVPARH